MENNLNTNDMINSVLSNPEMLCAAISAAQKIMGEGIPSSSQSNPNTDEKKSADGEKIEVLEAKSGAKSNDKIALLCAIKPYVSPERCKKIDDAVRILRLVDFAKQSNLLGSVFRS